MNLFALFLIMIHDHGARTRQGNDNSPSLPYTSCRPNKTYRVHFEIHDFSSRERDDDLPMIDGASRDGFFTGGLPFVDSTIRANVTNPVGIYLPKRNFKN